MDIYTVGLTEKIQIIKRKWLKILIKRSER